MDHFNECHQTKAEKRLAVALQKKKLSFEQNQSIEGYEVDFWFPKYGLVVEVDGFTHLSDQHRLLDHRKDQVLMAKGFVIIRLNNNQIYENINLCLTQIETLIARIKSLKSTSNINDHWKEPLRKTEFKKEKTSKKIRTIEEYFLSIDDDPE
jgi:very-short-patch-repair endonuclease